MCKQDWSSISGASLDISQDGCQVLPGQERMGQKHEIRFLKLLSQYLLTPFYLILKEGLLEIN